MWIFQWQQYLTECSACRWKLGIFGSPQTCGDSQAKARHIRIFTHKVESWFWWQVLPVSACTSVHVEISLCSGKQTYYWNEVLTRARILLTKAQRVRKPSPPAHIAKFGLPFSIIPLYITHTQLPNSTSMGGGAVLNSMRHWIIKLFLDQLFSEQCTLWSEKQGQLPFTSYMSHFLIIWILNCYWEGQFVSR